MLWGSGNSVYGTAGVYLNPYTDYLTATSFQASDWFRSSGTTGWYNATYAVGIYAIDSTWVRTYNNAQFYSSTIIQAGASVRGPIFYDSDDTGYYLNPAGASNLYGATFNNPLTVGNSGVYMDWWKDGSGIYMEFTGNSTATRKLRLQGHNGSNDYTQLFIDGGNGYVYTNKNFRATVFYDQDNTGYYLDPASTSNLSALSVNSTMYAYNGIQFYRNGSASTGISWYNASYYNWQEYMAAASATGCGPNGNLTAPSGLTSVTSWALRSRMEGVGTYGWLWEVGSGGGGGATASAVMELDISGNLTAAGSHRAPIFYDYNNTGYYIDPASTSVLNDLRINAGATQLVANNVGRNTKWRGLDGSTDVGISFYNNNNTWAAQFYANTGDGYGFLNGNWAAWDMKKVVSGNLYLNNQTTYYISGDTSYFYRSYGTADMRSPIYYDLDNTGYYVDPAGTARLSYVVANGGIRIDGNENLYLDNNYGQSIVGVYASTRYQGVFAMGNSYKLPIDGTSTGSLYGLAWSHPNAGGVAGNLNTHGLLAMENGTWLASLTGSTRARDDMRAPLFYDNNDTGYYIDMNSTSNSAGRIRGGILFGPNVTWGAYLRIGGDGNPDTSVANIAATNGNLHLDSRAGYAMYLNNYANGVIYLNGGTYYISSNGSYYNGTAENASYGRYVYNNGAYSGSGWVEASDLGVRYANSAGSAPASGGTATALNSSNYINQRGSTGNWNNDFQSTPAGTLNYGGDLGANSSVGPGGSWWFQQNFRHTNGGNYWGTQVAWGWEDNANRLAQRNITGNSFSGWVYYLNSGNYTSYIDAPNRAGTSYYQVQTWLQMNGAHGMYWPSYNGAHIYANTTSSYTQLRFDGVRNGYTGVYLGDSAVHGMMYDTAGNGGVYREANGRWYWYYHLGNACMGINTSSTSSSYAAYIGGALYATGNICAYSDVRKKENIETIDNALDKVNKMRGVYYNRTDDETKKKQTGVIAQEMEQVLPEVVNYAADVDEYSVAYGNIVGVLIEAIKEQQLQIDELKALLNK